MWTEEAKLVPPPTQRDLRFGTSTCISGDSLVVGARGFDSSQGRVWIYQRTGASWLAHFPEGFSAPDTASPDNFGRRVSIVGRTALIGAPLKAAGGAFQAGRLYVYENVGSAWVDVAHISSSQPTAGLHLGESLSFDGVTIACGSDAFSSGGAVHAFRLGWPSFCFGDGSMSTRCPCAAPDIVPSPSGIPRSGCANSLNLDGARLTARGLASPDHVELDAFIGPNHTGFAMLVKGDGRIPSGVASGDGIRCVDGAMVRFGGHDAGANGDDIGFWSYPNTAQTASVSAITGQLPGQIAFYQLLYRNAAPGFCSPDTVNWTGAVQIDR